MAICLTNKSVRLLGAYFQRKLESGKFYSPDKAYEDIIKDLYNSAVKDFKGKIEQLADEETSDEEVILQHMTIVPNLLGKYLLNSGQSDAKIMNRVAKESPNIFNAFQEGASPQKLITILNRYADMVSGKTIVTTDNNPVVNYIIPGVHAINWHFAANKAQFSKKGKNLGVLENVEDSKFVYHTNALRTIIGQNNSRNYKYKLTTKKAMANEEGFLGDLVPGKNPPILVIVDSENKVVRFNESGAEDSNGMIPAFELRRTASDLGVSTTKAADGTIEVTGLHKTYNTPAKAKIQYLVQKEKLSEQEAQQAVFQEVGSYLTNLNSSIEKAKAGEEVYMEFDLGNSSFGFLEENDMSITNLMDIENFAEGFTISTKNTFKSTQAILHIPNSVSPVYLQRQALKNLSQDKLDVIIELLTNNNLLNENKTVLTSRERLDLLGAYLEMADSSYVPIKPVFGLKADKNKVVAVNLAGVRTPLSEVKEAFNDFINKFHTVDYDDTKPRNYPMASSLSEVLVHNQVFEPEEGKLVKAMYVPISANLGSNPSDLGSTFPRPVKISEDGVVVTENVSFEQHLMETSYTRVVPNAKGEIKTVSPYIAFHNVDEQTGMESAPSMRLKFMSIEEGNRSTEKLVRGEEQWAVDWLNTLGLENSKLSVTISEKIHKHGPGYLASFFIDSIVLYGGSNKTALYHEVFHAYVDGIMSPAEKMAMLKEVKNAFAGQKLEVVVAGKKKTIDVDSLDLSKEEDQLAIEEWLAEQFRAYAREESYLKNKDLKKTKSFFKRLLDFLRKLLGFQTSLSEVTVLATQSAEIQAIFNDLYTGNVDFSKFQPVQMDAEKFQSLEVDNDLDMTEQEVYTTMTSMQALFHNYIDLVVNPSSNPKVNRQMADLQLAMSFLNEKTKEYKELQEQYNDLWNKNALARRGAGMYLMQNNPELVVKAMKWMLNRMRYYSENSPNEDATKLFDKIFLYYGGVNTTRDKDGKIVSQEAIDIFVDEEGKPLPAQEVIENLTDRDDSLLGVFYNKYTTLNVTESTFEEDELQAQRTEAAEYNWDRSGNEYDIADTVDKYTKEMLSTLPVFKNQGTTMDTESNLLGVPKLMPYSMAIVRFLRATEGAKNRVHMYEKLQAAAYEETFKKGAPVKVKDYTLLTLLQRLGDPRTILTDEQQTQWNRLYLSLGKPTVRLRTAEFIKEENDETKEVTITSRTGKNKLSQVQIKNSWKFNFIHLAENVANKESMFKDENGTRVIDIEKVLAKHKAIDEATGKAKWKSDPAALLREFGVNIPSTEETSKMLKSGSAEYGIDPNFVTDLIEKLELRLEIETSADMEMQKGYPLNRLDSVFSEFAYNVKRANNTYEPKTSRNLTGYLNNLADFAASYNDEYVTYMSWTPGGERQSEKTFHSSITVQLLYLNDAEHIDDIVKHTPGMEHLDYKRNPILAANKGFVQMFNLDKPLGHPDYGKRNEKISIIYENNVGTKISYKNQEVGVKSIKSDERTKFATEFLHVLKGRQEILRTEAKSSSFSHFIPIMKDGERGRLRNALYLNGNEIATIFENPEYANLKGARGSLLFDQFGGYIEAELIRMHRIQRYEEEVLKNLAEDETAEFDAQILNRGKKFIIFDLILSSTTRNELKELGITESFSLNEMLKEKPNLKARIEVEIREYFEMRSDQLKRTFDSELILADNDINDFRLNEEEEEDVIRTRMYNTAVVNSFLQYLSFQSIFLGDPVNYDIAGENFHKRIAGATSTGTIFVDDEAWHDYVNSDNFENDGFAKKHFENLTAEQKSRLESLGMSTTFKTRPYRGYLRTAAIAEAESTSDLLPHYADVIGVTNTKAYKGMEEADGSAWITFDRYRLLAKASDEWSDGQEELYQKMLAGEKINWLKHKNTFPIRKYQYYGPAFNSALKNAGLSNMEFHKFSVVPLIPNAIEETRLRTLHERMMEEGLDYVMMDSASKLGVIQKVDKEGNALPNTVYKVTSEEKDGKYSTTREITNEAFVQNVIHVKHLKSQVHMAEGFKGKITLFSQMRKMSYLGIYDGGAPADFMVGEASEKRVAAWEKLKEQFHKGKKSLEDILKISYNGNWALRYEQKLDLMSKVLKDELIEELGLVEQKVRVGKQTVIEYKSDNKKLLNYLRQELKNKDLLPEEIEGIIDPLTGEMIEDLSLSLNSAKIEEILTTLIDKKLRAIKVTGEGFVQQTGSMMEKDPQFVLDQDVIRDSGTNNLGTYAGLDEDGNLVETGTIDDIKQVRFMDVKIAMQGGFQNLFYLEYENEVIAQYYDVKDQDGKVTGREFDYDASLAKLNEAMRNDVWFEEHKQFLTLTGPRIPTQAFASLEAAYVREFLPGSVGKAIVLPSEIVAKAGSDFDIDKLFLMYPNIRKYGKSVELVRYKEDSRTYDEMSKEMEELDDKLQPLVDELDALKEERRKISQTFKDIKNKPSVKAEVDKIDAKIEELIAIRKENKKNLDTVMKQASDIYKRKGKYKNISDADQKLKHETSKAFKADVLATAAEITKQIDALYEKRNKVILEAFGEKFTGVKEEDTPKIFKDAVFAQINEKIDAKIEQIESNREEYGDVLRAQDGIGTKGIENDLIDLFTERITDPNMIKSLVEPNSTDFFDDIAETIGKKLEAERIYKKFNDGTLEGTQETIAGSTTFDLQFNLIKHQENSVGLDSLGVAAVTSVYYAMLTEFGGYLEGITNEEQDEYQKAVAVLNRIAAGESVGQAQEQQARQITNKYKNYTLKFNHNRINIKDDVSGKLSSRVALGLIDNVEGRNISDIIGQLINGFVDVAKNPWVFNVQGNMENTPQLLFLMMAGVKVDEIAKYVNLPFIVEYNNIKAQLSGAVSNLNRTYGESPIKSDQDIVKEARAKMFKKYQKLVTKGMKRPVGSRQYTQIADLLGNLSDEVRPGVSRIDDLFELSNTEDFEQFKAFAHYLEIEDMAKDFTVFTMATKYDTQKMSNISDAEAREHQRRRNLDRDNSIPNKWYGYFDNNVSGVYNNDRFIIQTLSRLFALRNNPIIRYKSTKIQRTEETMDKDMSSLRKMYKDQFMNFLYQNSIFKDNYYNRHFFVADSTITKPIQIDEATNTIRYNANMINRAINEADGLFGVVKKTLTGELAKMYEDAIDEEFDYTIAGETEEDLGVVINEGVFPTQQHYIRYAFELERVKKEFTQIRKEIIAANEGATPQEIMTLYKEAIYDKYYYVSRSSPVSKNMFTADFVAKVLALYRSGNNISMFRKSIGYASIFKNITDRHPELADKFELVRNLQPRYDDAFMKSNLALMNNKDAQMIRIYRENLIELQHHHDPVIRDFFMKFDNYALLQTGMERGSMYDLGRVVTSPNLFADIINDGVNKDNRFLNELELAYEAALKDGVENVDLVLIQKFDEVFNQIVNSKEVLRRNKGVNLMKPGVTSRAIGEIVGSSEGTNVKIYDSFTGQLLKSSSNPNGLVIINSAEELYTERSVADEDAQLTLLDLKPVSKINRSSKKETFSQLNDANEMEDREGYRLTFPDHSKVEMFIYKNESQNKWVVVEGTTGYVFPIRTPYDASTAKSAIESVKNIINGFIESKAERNIKILAEVGMFAEEIEAYQDNSDMKLNLELLEQYSNEANVGILAGNKLLAPDGMSQKELDNALLQYLGIDNFGSVPRVTFKSHGTGENSLSVIFADTGLSGSEVNQKRKEHHEILANQSTKAIGRNAEGGSSTDYIQPYATYLLEAKKNTLAGDRVKFNSEDKVWIFGNQSTNQTRGSLSLSQLNAVQEELFNDYYVKYIDQAIDAGVNTFFVDAFNGVNFLARKHLESKGYYGIPRYTENGKYFEYVKPDTYSIKEGDLVRVGEPVVTLENMGMEMLLDSEVQKEIGSMSLADIRSGKAKEKVYASIVSILAGLNKKGSKTYNLTKYQQFIRDYVDSDKRPIQADAKYTDLYRSLVEQVLLELRPKYVSKVAQKNEARQRKVDKTEKGLVKIFPTGIAYKMVNGKKKLNYDDMLAYAKANNGIYSMRRLKWDAQKKEMVDTINHFGNPFGIASRDTAGKYGIAKVFDTTRGAVKAYLDWLTTDKYDAEFPELKARKRWIWEAIRNGELKGRTVFYYQEKNQSTHANALDYLINEVDTIYEISQEDVEKLPKRQPGC